MRETSNTTQHMITVLRQFNAWRRGEGYYEEPGRLQYSPKEIGEAIDYAIQILQSQQHERK